MHSGQKRKRHKYSTGGNKQAGKAISQLVIDESDEKHGGCCKDPKAISSIFSDYTLPLGVQGVLGE